MATQNLQKFDSTSFLRDWPTAAGIGVVGGVVYANLGGTITPLSGQGNQEAYLSTATGTNTLLAAAPIERIVQINVRVVTVFANGTGNQPVFEIGATDTDAFMGAAVLVNAAAATIFSFAGVLPANQALVVTATAAVGNGTGAITVTATAVPSA